jgi:hypothetical protein
MATNLTGLNNFKKKLQNYSNINASFTNSVAEEIAKRGVQIAQEEYAGMDKVIVSHETMSGGRSRVVAERKGLAYIEFGTGDVGKESNYPTENLPKQGVPITGEWKYYYLPSDSKKTINGRRGWMLGSNFITGRSAGMQMYRTSKRLKNEMINIVKNKIRGDSANV